MRLLHAGFDGLDVAFQGALPVGALDALRQAKEKAAQTQEPVLAAIGPAGVQMRVHASGMGGGYAFRADTGPAGEVWAFKDTADPTDRTIFASVRAAALAVHGFDAACARLSQRLRDMGARVAGESVNRVDYALDFAMSPHFALDVRRFVAHPRAKTRPHWSERRSTGEDAHPSAVLRGRRLESVTIGKMPGRQVIVYDKRREAIDRGKLFWFKVWGVDRLDPSVAVWRVEVRAGKRELSRVWNLRTFDDVLNGIGDVFTHALHGVRYVDEAQTDTNITRKRPHPLWRAALHHLETSLFDHRSGLTPGQLLELEREQAVVRYQSNLRGNIAGMAVALGLDDDAMEVDLPEIIGNETRAFVEDHDGRFGKSVQRVRERLYFVRTPGRETRPADP